MAVRVRLERKIEILTPTETNLNGDVVKVFSFYFSAWAERKDKTDKENEQVEAMSIASTSYTEWIIAYPPANLMPTTKMRIKELATNAEYDIENISEPEKSVKEYLVLRCKQTQQR